MRYTDGRKEVVEAGEVYYWPPGHTVWFEQDTEFVEFSPAEEMNKVLSHVASKMASQKAAG